MSQNSISKYEIHCLQNLNRLIGRPFFINNFHSYLTVNLWSCWPRGSLLLIKFYFLQICMLKPYWSLQRKTTTELLSNPLFSLSSTFLITLEHEISFGPSCWTTQEVSSSLKYISIIAYSFSKSWFFLPPSPFITIMEFIHHCLKILGVILGHVSNISWGPYQILNTI